MKNGMLILSALCLIDLSACSGKSKRNEALDSGKNSGLAAVISNENNQPTAAQIKIIQNDEGYKNFLAKNTELDEAFSEIEKTQPSTEAAIEKIKKWNPQQIILNDYKNFYISTWSKNTNGIHQLYLSLLRNKKFLRLRMQLLSFLISADIENLHFSQPTQFIKTEARSLLRKLNGTSEAEIFETQYLKWLYKNKFYQEICSHEKNHWIGESEIDYVDLTAATGACPLTYDEFITRIRRLVFAAKEYQALREIEMYMAQNKIKSWEKAYLKAIYDSNVGDPVSAFKNLVAYENELLDSDYKDNYFYIAQRAGELEKSEEIINKILKNTKDLKELKEMKFQQGFLFYQIRKYAQAHEIFDKLYKEQFIHKRKKTYRVSAKFDQLAWLRGWTLYLDGRYSEALKALSETMSYVKDEARLAYWIADIQLKLGEESAAIAGFQKLATPLLKQKSFS
jgi:hypothetical protein